MKTAEKNILIINSGSSSIKMSVLEANSTLRLISDGSIERIGSSKDTKRIKDFDEREMGSPQRVAHNRNAATDELMTWIKECSGCNQIVAVGHRIVHGGPHYISPQLITTELIAELHRMNAFAPEHIPGELLAIEALRSCFPNLPQVACFDTAFHQNMPRLAHLLPIPRRFEIQGIRRYGFHGGSIPVSGKAQVQ